MDFAKKQNEFEKNKSKSKYITNKNNINKQPSFINSKREKTEKNKSIKSKNLKNEKSIKNTKKTGYFENILKNINNTNIVPLKIKNPISTFYNINYTSEPTYDYDYISSQLVSKDNDTYEDLKHKNKKLRELIIKISKQLELLYNKYESIKINAENEKKNLLEKLDKISTNYKLYAESYKENMKLKKEKEILNENCSQMSLIYNTCKSTLISLIKKNMNYYTKLKMFYENKNSQFKAINFDEFIFSLKEEFLNNLIQYKNHLDAINYPSFYYEFNLFINQECNYCGIKKQDNNINNNPYKLLKNNNTSNTTYRQHNSLRNERKENRTTRLMKGNNSYDEYRKYKDEKNQKDKSPKLNKKYKNNSFIRQKTPSKNNYDKPYEDLSFNNNNTYFNKSQYNNIIEENEKNNNIFDNVGNVINYNKRYSFIK